MIKHGIQNYVNRQLNSTASCTLSRFTTLKSGVLVGFSALPWQSGNVVALYRGNVMAWCCGSVLKCLVGTSAASDRRAPGLIRAGQAGSCELEAASWASWSKLRAAA